MEIMARQLTLDMYNCNSKKLGGVDEIRNILENILGDEPKLTSEETSTTHFAIIGASVSGHIALHVYKDLRYVAVDIFTCAENSEPEELSKELRKFFQPDKIKSTFLKRGDFGREKDMKPKIKTRVAPLRKVKNAGAKVVSNLVRGGGR